MGHNIKSLEEVVHCTETYSNINPMDYSESKKDGTLVKVRLTFIFG